MKRDDPTQPEIAEKPKFGPYFANCIGALDGTHVPAIDPPAEQRPFRIRKKQLSQNVLAVANFNQTYSYALTGWEGSAHDSRVLNDAKLRGLPLFPGKYYLGDARYALSWHVLTPYRGVLYHLKEWRIAMRDLRMHENFLIFDILPSGTLSREYLVLLKNVSPCLLPCNLIRLSFNVT